MAIFGAKKKTVTKKTDPAKSVKLAVRASNPSFLAKNVIIMPRITEKSARGGEQNVYTFDVTNDSTKKTIADSVRSLYNVTPLRVAVARIPKKKVFARGIKGMRGGGKKAYVYLKKGDTIEFV